MKNPTSLPLPEQLVWVIDDLHARGWAPGTGGNFSVVQKKDTLELLMSPSSIDKGMVTPESLVTVNNTGTVVAGSGKASAEVLIHVALVECLGAGAVLHTHSFANTILSHRHCAEGQLVISGFEMLKALSGVVTHEHEEIVPIIKNSQDIEAVSKVVRGICTEMPKMHGLLLSGHGLYTWGKDLMEARRHVEAFEFLFEVVLRGNII